MNHITKRPAGSGRRAEPAPAPEDCAQGCGLAPVACLCLDREARVRQASLAGARLLGRERAQLAGRDFVDFLAPECRAAVADLLRRAVADHGLETCEVTLQSDDPAAPRTQLRIDVQTDAQGECTHIALVDISECKRREEELRRANERLSLAERSASAGAWEWDFATGKVTWSDGLFRLFGLDPATTEPGLAAWQTVVHPADRQAAENCGASAIRDRKPLLQEYRVVLPDGSLRWVDSFGEVICDDEGARLRIAGLCIDATARKQAEERLRASEERFRKLFEDTHQAILLVEDDRFVAVNQAALAMLRMERPDQLLGLSHVDISPPAQPDGRPSAEAAAAMARIASEQGFHEFEWEYVRADGEPFTTRVLLTLIHQGDKNLLHGVLTDITDQKKAREQIDFLAYHDTLTGLPNRMLGQDRLRHEVATAARHHTRLAVLYLDLDKFKYVNDTYGHAQGDSLLKGVAMRLTRCLRAGDTPCRLAGDEFMVVLPDLQAHEQLSNACERILDSLADPFDLAGVQFVTSFSIGVAICPRDGTDDETLMRHADMALYAAKKAGPNSYRFFEPEMNARMMRYVRTRESLRQALDRQEFELHYQPQIDLRSGRTVSVEALIRWRRPGYGLVMPDNFLAAAEDSGLIGPIGRWALREACRQAAAWHDVGMNDLVVTATNLSPVQFRKGNVEQDVLAALDESRLDPACLELELTESILLRHEEAVMATLARWTARGVRLAIDDFGTGYSSLSYLKDFKLDKLKIDRAFVSHILDDDNVRAIVQAIIAIARSLKLKTVAEGVEDAATADQLRAMGCDAAQGYLYSRPLPAAELVEWLKKFQS